MEEMMVDIETTGLQPNRNAMIQLAAVKFDLRENKIGGIFNASLTIPPNRSWDEDTREWWLRDKRHILQRILANGRYYKDVMADFASFCSDGSYRFWSKPLSFDFPFIQSYCYDYETPMPFRFWESVDLRAWARGRFEASGAPLFSDKDVPFDGEEHDALNDTLHQVKYALMVNSATRLRVLEAAE